MTTTTGRFGFGPEDGVLRGVASTVGPDEARAGIGGVGRAFGRAIGRARRGGLLRSILAGALFGGLVVAAAQITPASAQGQSGDAPGQSGDAPGQSGDAPDNAADAPGQADGDPGRSGDAPGQSEGAPGQSGDAPGQTGAAPGLAGDTPGQSGEAPGQSRGKAADDDADLISGSSAARRAVAAGRALPVGAILQNAREELGGEIIKVEFRDFLLGTRYILTMVTARGRLVLVDVDASTGELLGVRGL